MLSASPTTAKTSSKTKTEKKLGDLVNALSFFNDSDPLFSCDFVCRRLGTNFPYSATINIIVKSLHTIESL